MTLPEFLRTTNQVSRRPFSGWLGGTRFAMLVFVLQLPFSLPGQNITSISGFRPSAEIDPLAKKDVLEVMAPAARVAGLGSGIEATVTVACKEQVPTGLLSVLATLTGGSVLGQSRLRAALGFTVGLSGANLDIQTENVTHSDYSPIIGPGISTGVTTYHTTQERSVIVRMRFDGDDTIQNAAPANEPHHISFSYFDIARATRARGLILGVSSNGRPIYLQLNATEPVLSNLIQQCAAIDKRYEAEAAEEKKKQLIPGGPAFSSPLSSGVTAVLGERRLIPPAGARFVPVTEEEAKEIVIKQARRWYDYDPRARQDQTDYAPAFKSAAILPAKTECGAVETSKPRFIVASPGQDPRARQLVTVAVGRGNVDLVKLADGRFGLTPFDDLSQG